MMTTMRTIVCAALALFLSCAVSYSQDFSFEKYPNRVELSVGNQLFAGDGGVMDYFGMKAGFRFHPDWSLRAGFSSGIGNDWRTHRADIADFGIARIVRNIGLENFEMHTSFGVAYRWDRYSDNVTGKVLGMVEIESRFYVSRRGFLSTSVKAYAGKNHVQASFLGITWGVRF